MAAINTKYVQRYDYPEISSITVDDIGRVYQTPGGTFSSITTMLSATSDHSALDEWRDRIGHVEADKITRDAGIKGTTIHDVMEQWLKGNDVDALLRDAPPLVVHGFKSLKMYRKYITDVWGLEVALYDSELGIAGRTDVVGCWKDRPAIIDWKTSRRKKRREWVENYMLQTLFYSIAHNVLFGTNITMGVFLIAVENDWPQIFEIDFEKEDWLWTEFANRVSMFKDSGSDQLILDQLTGLDLD